MLRHVLRSFLRDVARGVSGLQSAGRLRRVEADRTDVTSTSKFCNTAQESHVEEDDEDDSREGRKRRQVRVDVDGDWHPVGREKEFGSVTESQ